METTVITQNEKKSVRISLMQTSKQGKVNASFVFSCNSDNFEGFLQETAKKINKVFELQAKIKENKGKNNIFGLTKSGDFELNISTATEEGTTKILNNFVFNLSKLGDAENNLPLLAEGFKLLTE